MKTIVKVLLRGLAVVLPVVVTLYVLWWLGSTAEGLLGELIPQQYYVPGMGILSALVVVFAVGLLAGFWVFNTLFAWAEKLLERIPLVKTLYSSVKDLMGFFPSAEGKPAFNRAVVANVAGARIVGLVTREDFSGLPEALHGKDEVLVYLPMSYQLGGFTVWLPRREVTPVELTAAEAMRFAMTGGMTTGETHATAPAAEAEKTE